MSEDPKALTDAIMSQLLGSSVVHLEHAGLKPISIMAHILFEDQQSATVGLANEQYPAALQHKEVMYALERIALQVMKRPELGDKVLDALKEVLGEQGETGV